MQDQKVMTLNCD